MGSTPVVGLVWGVALAAWAANLKPAALLSPPLAAAALQAMAAGGTKIWLDPSRVRLAH